MKLIPEENEQEQSVTIMIDGSIDTLTAPDLEDFLTRYYGKVRKITLDFLKVSYISSAGLRALLKADKAMGGNGNFSLKNINSDVKEVLTLTGFCDIITIC